MRKIGLIVMMLVFFSTLPAMADGPVKGTIHFVDGSTVGFYDAIEWRYLGGVYTDAWGEDELKVKYQNSERNVPFDKLKSVEIDTYQFGCSRFTSPCLKDSVVVVETVTGVRFKNDVSLLGGITVKIRDDLTGEVRNQAFYFGEKFGPKHERKSRLIIRKVTFEHTP